MEFDWSSWESVLGIVLGVLLGIVILLFGKNKNKSEEVVNGTKMVKDAKLSSGGCPFGFTSDDSTPLPANHPVVAAPPVKKTAVDVLNEFKAKQGKVIFLYEQYVHLPALASIWSNPITAYPRMEPYFAASCHGIELSFLLLAEFINDKRPYMAKRSRIEAVCHDITVQCQLLAELLDGELEDTSIDSTNSSDDMDSSACSSAAPPTIPTASASSCVSPGLELLTKSLKQSLEVCSNIEKISLKKLVKTVVNTFHGNFGPLTLGFGFENQIAELCNIVGVPVQPSLKKETSLDYALLVRPQVAIDTLIKEKYNHAEDFFFRTVHLGTECWAFIAISRIKVAKDYASSQIWYQAAAQIRYAASILNYLGDHVMLLTAMVLRDYLELKVEIQGTSGEGSLAVKSFKSLIYSLFDPLIFCLLITDGNIPTYSSLLPDQEQELKETLHLVYSSPDSFPGLYEYCKALECIESALLGGFYYKHYLLASNVIGTLARGTMNRSVEALKATFSTSAFPMLDEIRADLGAITDAEFAHKKGNIMNQIVEKYKYNNGGVTTTPAAATVAAHNVNNTNNTSKPVGRYLERCRLAERGFGYGSNESLSNRLSPISSFNKGSKTHIKSPIREVESHHDLDVQYSEEDLATCDRTRRSMYSVSLVSKRYLTAKNVYCTNNNIPDLQFLDHAFGCIPPIAYETATEEMYTAYCGMGNYSWDILFEKTMPEAVLHIKSLLDIKDATTVVEFGHNSHELVTRIISTSFDRLLNCTAKERPIRIITTDTEFYSLTRQINRFTSDQTSHIEAIIVPIHPLDSFMDRLVLNITSVNKYIDFVYISQITYSQETVIPSIPEAVQRIKDAVCLIDQQYPIVMIDGYHGFGAIPTSLDNVDCIYISGVLKHVGAGANLAFAVVPDCYYNKLQPVLTGWLADVSVLSNGKGVSMGDNVGYSDGLRLMGSTPSFHSSMVLFNHVMRLWVAHRITVPFAHNHVMRLQERFLNGLKKLEASGATNVYISTSRLALSSSSHVLSHTLVFLQSSPEDAKQAVDMLKSQGVAIDCRKTFLRIGFGLNHNPEDVDRLLSALKPPTYK